MTTTENKSTDADRVQFRAFSWVADEAAGELMPAAMLNRSVETSRNLVGGLGVVLAMLEREELDREVLDEHGAPFAPFFTAPDRGNLLRMCIGICDALRDAADLTIERMSEYREANNGGRR
ncbi:hypothetical protein [Sphaerotilus microaerophilus]|jgi:hypothetical protein|uniref:Uncharacterized protein n=1 Tax=Sphaerotilus microaerophilus TaxID=2914710 RepID=A0ABN6PHM9_9BURK|nr:hypothetical protein [Sphaerotilus sp. FB-5]BDI04514.1 hypothetical protein CATMQ487_14840 [Sphaerotilus sp. FB-5]